jgi:hypothetical protein
MRTLSVVLLGLGLGFAFETRASDQPEQSAPAARAAPAPAAERPRGVCQFSQPGLSMVIEDTTEEACHERQAQCGHDNPGREAECRGRWTISEEKANRTRKGKPVERAASAPGTR